MKHWIPNAVTLAGAGAALLAILWAPTDAYAACNAIIVASLVDMIDGRIARSLNAQSQIGAQLDSLVDLLSFGVAPAVLAFYVQLSSAGEVGPIPLGVLPLFAFVAASAIRLAKFNAQAQEGSKAFDDKFTGIPTPVAALLLTTPIMAHHEIELAWVESSGIGAAWICLVAVLMVLPVRFPSFKSFRSRLLQAAYFSAMAGGVGLLIFGLPGGTVLFGFLVFYLVLGFGSMLRRQ